MVTLTTSEIRKLYGFKANQEVVAFGRNIKNTSPGRTNARQFTHDELMKFRPARPQVIESEVQEIL